MKRQTKHTSQEQEQAAGQEKQQQVTAREFTSPEELLRHDAAQTLVPPTVANRLAESLRSEPKPERSWWQRMFGR
jgi:hypothetical protein